MMSTRILKAQIGEISDELKDISKKEGEVYKKARKSAWGDIW